MVTAICNRGKCKVLPAPQCRLHPLSRKNTVNMPPPPPQWPLHSRCHMRCRAARSPARQGDRIALRRKTAELTERNWRQQKSHRGRRGRAGTRKPWIWREVARNDGDELRDFSLKRASKRATPLSSSVRSQIEMRYVS